MEKFTKIIIVSLAILASGSVAQAANALGKQPHTQAYDLSDHQSIGKPGDEASVKETITISVSESATGGMDFEPNAIPIEHGSVVRFIIKNTGLIDHEFFLGSFKEIEEHRQWMREHPSMEHADPNAVKIPSGQTAELIWEFSEITNLEFACLLPGHREAGMWGVILVHDHLTKR